MTGMQDDVALTEERGAEEKALRIISGLKGRRHSAAIERMQLVVSVLGDEPADDAGELIRQIADLLQDGETDRLWLARAVIEAKLPTTERMKAILRRARLGGPWSVLTPALRALRAAPTVPIVRVDVGRVTCDVHSTAETDFLSGIQRVVRAVAVRWHAERDVHFLGWTDDFGAMRELTDLEHARMFSEQVTSATRSDRRPVVVVPWRGVHLVPELPSGALRVSRIAAIGRYSGCRVGIIGYDVIPLTTSSSVAPGMVGAFSHYLAACRDAHRIVAISDAAGEEYKGWRSMLAGIRGSGPEIGVATLPVAGQTPSVPALARAQLTLGLTSAPMVLVVGSHEPRKNHLAVLHAAELLWREGLRFTLTFVGASSWRAEAFEAGVAELHRVGRAIRTIRGLPDDELWAGFQLAHCTLFPSLNEGYGLPVAESLAVGTPVIASDFGSTRDIVAPAGTPLGGLLVDPRDDHAIADALRTMLTDPETYQRLRAEAAQHQPGSWDDYADQVWAFLVEDGPSADRH